MALTLTLPKSLRHRLLARGFERRGPWVTQFKVDGIEYGGETAFDDDPRLDQFRDAFPDVRRILELGCLEGGQTVELARRLGMRITAVEGRHANLERARWVSRLFRTRGVTFIEADLEQRPPSSFGQFDVVFCVGLLYHLENPFLAIRTVLRTT